MPPRFWSIAYQTVMYLISCMPTFVLNLHSPFDKIFNKPLNYHKLGVFGCLCQPWLCPYTSHKLEPCSRPCVFVGYSNEYNAYSCLHPKTYRIFMSRHVVFIESVFPFKNSSFPAPSVPDPLLNQWLISISSQANVENHSHRSPILDIESPLT